MALLVQCLFANQNNKLPIVKECIASLMATVNLKKHRWVVINNSCWKETEDYLDSLPTDGLNVTVIHLKENVGTARGINIGLRCREPGEFCGKLDDDLTWGQSGWVELMEREIKKRPEIGILGLRREDVYGELIPEGKLLWNHDIFGTCTMYNPAMLDKVGELCQFSTYSFDDSIFSIRSEAAGFRNAFMRYIKITNLDRGGTPYTEWKKREASVWIQEASIYMDLIRRGKISYYYAE